MATAFPDEMKVEEALCAYFQLYHFKDGGYNDRTFHIKLGPVYIPFPNTPSRIAAVKMHDIHHVLTSYKADWKGEIEIAGWEIAGGCGKYYAAWFLNSGSYMIGLFLYPRSLMRGFIAGKCIKSNLYHGEKYDSHLLQRNLGELRNSTGINNPRSPGVTDYFAFLFTSVLALFFLAGMVYLVKLITNC